MHPKVSLATTQKKSKVAKSCRFGCKKAANKGGTLRATNQLLFLEEAKLRSEQFSSLFPKQQQRCRDLELLLSLFLVPAKTTTTTSKLVSNWDEF